MIMKFFLLLKMILVILLTGPFACFAQWSLTGNAGTDPLINFIGTSDNKDFRIRTNSSIRLNVASDGKVAIGNFIPAYALDVKGSFNTDSVYRIEGYAVLSKKGSGNI